MAKRRFWTIQNGRIAVGVVEFKWEAGSSVSQRRRSCQNMHDELLLGFEMMPLDISSASSYEIGVELSAFNLFWNGRNVESLYQGSKVFSISGSMNRLYNMSSRDAKAEVRKAKGGLVGFELDGVSYPLEPRTVFYDFVYLNGLVDCHGLGLNLKGFECFTDVQAKMEISACQARSVCIYKLLQKQDKVKIVRDFDKFLEWHKEHVEVEFVVD